MPSIFGHVLASSALTTFLKKEHRISSLFWVAGFCAFAPDLDVLAFKFGVAYSSIWGHRGWTHSLGFSIILGLAMGWLFYRHNARYRLITCILIMATLSHPLLDMMTNGGRGCALWWPLNHARLFFPFRPIQVSPLEIADFFSDWGIQVLWSELYWIGGPVLVIHVLAWFFLSKRD